MERVAIERLRALAQIDAAPHPVQQLLADRLLLGRQHAPCRP